MFQRFFDEGLAQSSYLAACPRTRRAAVIDPRRDVDVYVAAARQHGLGIDLAIETHIHADFVSGARELVALGASVIAGPGAKLLHPSREAHDRETFALGDVELEILHTPGHTPEHISILVREPHAPVRVLTGDTLFVGAVGRPDLLGGELMRRLAGELHESLFDRLLGLDDSVEVHPGHGAGSLCGTGIGSEPSSTIGQERRLNPWLQHTKKDAFITAVLGDLPETPPYFKVMKRVNQDGPAILSIGSGVPPPAALPVADVTDAIRRGAVLLDVRGSDAFGAAHPRGALNIPFGPKIGYWAGWMIPERTPIVLVVDHEEQGAEAKRQLLRVGLDAVAGYIAGGIDRWRSAGLPVAAVRQMTASELREAHARSPLTILDVRTAREWSADHIEGAIHVPVGDLPHRIAEIPVDRPVAAICEGGTRSSLAASLLARAGYSHVVNVRDGMTAWRST